MKRILPCILSFLILSGCRQLETILYSPPQTPETWLTIQPYWRIQLGAREIIFIQPSSTLFVYALGLLAIGVGLYFLRIRQGQRTRLWWGIALLLWGVGALFAGTSYEAFSYAIKCAGRTACIWTSSWELLYLIFSVASMDSMVLAVAYSSATGKLRKALIVYAAVNLGIYLLVILIGALIPVKFLISFELLLVFTAPSILLFFIINGHRYLKRREKQDLALLGAWAILGLVIGAYFLYLILGITPQLWAQGVWFSENDVLHIGLILWMLYLALVVARRVKDAPEAVLAAVSYPGL